MTLEHERTWGLRVWAFIAAWWQQIAITQAGIYLVASFGQGHGILPQWAAVTLAIGMEGTYLRGLIDVGHVRGRGRVWATMLIAGTYTTIILWGIAYILSLPAVGVIPAADLGPILGSIIAFVHVVPVAYTGLCAAMLHRARADEEGQREARRETEAEDRRRALEARLDEEAAEERRERRALELRRAEALNEIETEKQKALARLEYRQARTTEAAQHPHAAPAQSPHAAAPSAVRAMSKDELCEAVRAAHAADPGFSRADLARRAGWSEAMVRKVLKAIIEEG